MYGLFHGGCSSGLDVHHITSKGAGGSDVKENLVTLCRKHHIMAQNKQIPVEELRQILTIYYDYHY